MLPRFLLFYFSLGGFVGVFLLVFDNQVSRLRRKIELDPKNPTVIKTVWGGGYTLAAEVTRL